MYSKVNSSIASLPHTLASLCIPIFQGSGHVFWGEARQREVLGESWTAPSMAAPRESQERVHCVWTHRHQHTTAAGRHVAHAAVTLKEQFEILGRYWWREHMKLGPSWLALERRKVMKTPLSSGSSFFFCGSSVMICFFHCVSFHSGLLGQNKTSKLYNIIWWNSDGQK